MTKDKQTHVMVMQLLGKSLAVLEREAGQFSQKTVYMTAIQLVSILPSATRVHHPFMLHSNVRLSFPQMYRIELIHNMRLVHRDIKPGNMGIGKSGQLLYVFGKQNDFEFNPIVAAF